MNSPGRFESGGFPRPPGGTQIPMGTFPGRMGIPGRGGQRQMPPTPGMGGRYGGINPGGDFYGPGGRKQQMQRSPMQGGPGAPPGGPNMRRGPGGFGSYGGGDIRAMAMGTPLMPRMGEGRREGGGEYNPPEDGPPVVNPGKPPWMP